MDEKTGLGKETKFDFKYMPGYDTKTELGASSGRKGSIFGIEMLGLVGLALPVVAAGSVSFAASPFLRNIALKALAKRARDVQGLVKAARA